MRGAGRWTGAGVVLAVIALASCQEGGAEAAKGAKMNPTGDVAIAAVGGGQYGWKPRESDFGPQCLLVRSKAAWARIAGDFSMNPAETPKESDARIAAVDFSRQSLLVVTLGEVGSTGYSIAVDRIEKGPPMKLVLSGKSPRPDETVGMAMTYPFAIVVADLTAIPKDAVFEKDGKALEVERTVME